MSVPVSLEKLRGEMAGRDPAYLLTVTGDGRPHCVAVAVTWEGDDLSMAAGSTTVANAAARPQVSLLWPPDRAGGYSLIVDGSARPRAEGGPGVTVRPTKAVLHRAAPAGAGGGPDACRSDCVPVYRAPA